MKNTLTGRAIVIGDTETFASGFYKRQLVIETDGKYPQTVPITFAKESADKMAEKVSLGDPVEVDIDNGVPNVTITTITTTRRRRLGRWIGV